MANRLGVWSTVQEYLHKIGDCEKTTLLSDLPNINREHLEYNNLKRSYIEAEVFAYVYQY